MCIYVWGTKYAKSHLQWYTPYPLYYYQWDCGRANDLFSNKFHSLYHVLGKKMFSEKSCEFFKTCAIEQGLEEIIYENYWNNWEIKVVKNLVRLFNPIYQN